MSMLHSCGRENISKLTDSIVGKNGSGKSAFVDALSWVFGSRSQSLRSDNAQQLLNDRARSEGQEDVYSMCGEVHS